ncbi:MAG: DUF177 domain-containing protein [Thermodesulfobacteriota bacterium]
MKLNIRDIPEEGLTLELTEDASAMTEAAGGGPGLSFLSPVAARITVNLAGEAVNVEGELKAVLKLNCSRCLGEVEREVESAFFIPLMKEEGAEGKEGEERELTADEMDSGCLEGDTLDTTALLLGQLLSDVPMQPLCGPDCKGLCHRCGADLNKGLCSCTGEQRVDSRFVALKKFKMKR